MGTVSAYPCKCQQGASQPACPYTESRPVLVLCVCVQQVGSRFNGCQHSATRVPSPVAQCQPAHDLTAVRPGPRTRHNCALGQPRTQHPNALRQQRTPHTGHCRLTHPARAHSACPSLPSCPRWRSQRAKLCPNYGALHSRLEPLRTPHTQRVKQRARGAVAAWGWV